MTSPSSSTPPTVEVRAQVSRIVQSSAFGKKERLKGLLSFLVEKVLSGKGEDLTEIRLAQDVFGRRSRFEIGTDSLVRTTASRLRDELKSYYRGAGRRDPIVIAMAEFGYVPVIEYRQPVAKRTPDRSPDSLQVRALCKEGWHYLHRQAGPSLIKALGFFEEAVACDSTFVDAYCGIVDCCVLLNTTGQMSGLEVRRRAEAALLLAPRRDRNAKLLASAATIHAIFDWQWEQAEKEFRRALRLKPLAKIHFDFGSFCLLPIGRLEEAAEQLDSAREMDESSPRIMLHTAIVLYAQRRFAEAVDYCHAAMKMHAEFGGFQFWLGRIYAAQAEYDKALAAFSASSTRSPLLSIKGHQGYCLGRTGKESEAEALLQELESDRGAGQYVPPHAFALINLGLKRTDATFEWLERAADEYDMWLPLLLNVDPWLEHLRSDARAQRLLKRLNLAGHLSA